MNRRGTVIIETIVIVAALGAAATLAGWKPLQFLKPKPPTSQVTALQTDLAKAQAELEAARAARDAAAAAERARQEQQVRWAQQMASGAADTLLRQPAAHRTAETQLASDLLARANFGLAAAIGALPVDKQAEILAIVDKALSGVQAERDEARTALAAKDRELQAVTADREQIAQKLPILAAQLEAKESAAQTVQAKLKAKTDEVLVIAEKLDAKAREVGSLGASVDRILFWVLVIAGGWLFLVWGLPWVLKLLRPGRTKTVLREISGWAHGALYLDAKKKLAAIRQATTT
jgi:hypothetical protein